jgi:DNA-binding transcriptional LysR family regulator
VIAPLRRIEALDELRLDLIVLPKAYVPEAQPHEVLFEDVFTCIVWTGHSSVRDTMSMDQFRALPHVVVSFADDRRVGFDERFGEQAGVDRHAQVVASNFHALPSLIVGTERIATIQLRLAEKLAASYPIRIVPSPQPLPVLEESMLWHPRLDRDAGHQWLRGVMRTTARTLTEPRTASLVSP